MRVRIVRQPQGTVTGISLKYYRPGQVYELPPILADYLVAEEYAIYEMRESNQSPMPVEVDRRKTR